MFTTRPDILSIDVLRRLMADAGATKLYAKVLAANDNSKNQPYFGGDFRVLNILPAETPVAEQTSGGIFKSKLKFAWLGRDGALYVAPNAKLILYPQYPEVRFSGYLQGADPEHRPSDLMGTQRIAGRVLFLGVRDDGLILGYVVGPDSPLARDLATLDKLESIGVFLQIPFGGIAGSAENRTALLRALCRIATLGWIDSKRLTSDGIPVACNAPNCGGYTLEAELGITPNGYSSPDFRGWEVKQHGVTSFDRDASALITLMTPEPNDGFYVSAGVIPFVERYGYPDIRGRPDRRNFGGTFRVGVREARTALTLTLLGYDLAARKLSDPTGGIALVDDQGDHAAVWRYVGLIDHWKRKHASAVYVPSMRHTDPTRQYRYSSQVRLGTGTTFERFLAAIADGRIVYDPGIKIENGSSKPSVKRRSQFRMKSRDIPLLYDSNEIVDACQACAVDGGRNRGHIALYGSPRRNTDS